MSEVYSWFRAPSGWNLYMGGVFRENFTDRQKEAVEDLLKLQKGKQDHPITSR